MLVHLNHLSGTTTAAISTDSAVVVVDAALAQRIDGAITADVAVSLVLVGVDAMGREICWEIIHATAVAGTAVTVVRGCDDTQPIEWPAGTIVSGRLTAETVNLLARRAGRVCTVGEGYQLSPYDDGATLLVSGAVCIPSGGQWPAGYRVEIVRAGSALAYLLPDAGVVLHRPDVCDAACAIQWSKVVLHYLGDDEWLMSGDMAPASESVVLVAFGGSAGLQCFSPGGDSTAQIRADVWLSFMSQHGVRVDATDDNRITLHSGLSESVMVEVLPAGPVLRDISLGWSADGAYFACYDQDGADMYRIFAGDGSVVSSISADSGRLRWGGNALYMVLLDGVRKVTAQGVATDHLAGQAYNLIDASAGMAALTRDDGDIEIRDIDTWALMGVVSPTAMPLEVCWSPAGDFIAVLFASAPYISIYDVANLALVAQPVIPEPDFLHTLDVCRWTPDGAFLTVSAASAPRVTVVMAWTWVAVSVPVLPAPAYSRSCARVM